MRVEREGYKEEPFVRRGRSRFSFGGGCPCQEGGCPNDGWVFCCKLSKMCVVARMVQLVDVRTTMYVINKRTYKGDRRRYPKFNVVNICVYVFVA